MNNTDKTAIIENRKITEYLSSIYLGDVSLDKNILSPLRDEKHPSFHVFVGRWGNEMFIDHGAGISGDIIKLHMLLTGLSFPAACRDLAAGARAPLGGRSLVPATATGDSDSTAGEGGKTYEYGIRSGKSVQVSRYIAYTRLPLPSWVSQALGLYTDTYNNLCVPTLSGGVQCRGGLLFDGKTFSHNVGPAGISVCRPAGEGATIWYVVEGIGDLLALIDGAVGPKHGPGAGYLILNSCSNVAALIAYLSDLPGPPTALELYLDRDKRGNEATVKLLKAFPSAQDRRAEITSGKDLRDTWNAQHQ